MNDTIKFIKGFKGQVKVVSMERCLTYLTEGKTYTVECVNGKTVRFSSEQGGTFEQVSMLNVFQRQGRIVFEVVA